MMMMIMMMTMVMMMTCWESCCSGDPVLSDVHRFLASPTDRYIRVMME